MQEVNERRATSETTTVQLAPVSNRLRDPFRHQSHVIFIDTRKLVEVDYPCSHSNKRRHYDFYIDMALRSLLPRISAPARSFGPALRTVPLAQRSLQARTYATLSPDTPPPTRPYDVFDEDGKARQRDRAIIRLREATEAGEISGPEVLDYLREEAADRLAERVEVSRRRCPPGQDESQTA